MQTTGRSVLSVARSVLSDLDLEAVLARVLDAARELTGARYAAMGVLDESRTALARFMTVGVDDQTRRAIGPLPTGRGVLGELITSPEPLRLKDVGAHPHSYGFPAGHPPMTSFLGVPIRVAGLSFGNLYLCDKDDGAEFSQEDEDAVVLLADFAGIAIDHARAFTRSESRRGELERTVATLDATLQISRALGGQTDLGAILELVAKRGRALVSARALIIELVEAGEIVVAAGAGDLPDGLVGRRAPLRDTVAGAALRTQQLQRLEDELNRARFEQHGLGHLGVRAQGGLVVPLVFKNHSYGVLVAVDRLEDGPGFGPEDERLLQAFATSAATAVATAQTVSAERRAQRIAAAEEERRRWARELHDETLQGLAAVRLGLAAARRTKDPDAMATAVGEAVDQLAAEITGLRALITELRPAALDELGAGPAIEALAARAARMGLEVDVSVDLAYEKGRLGERHRPELETAIYRIAQEGLTNAAKHGGALRAVLEVIEDDVAVRVTVRDDGNGFDPSATTDGFGLVGMRERADLVGGTVTLDSAPGRGTTVHAVLPVGPRRGAVAQAPALVPRTG
ncbi:MAG: GAF domain-containing protein [Solirubrobacteraceae bacterium]